MLIKKHRCVFNFSMPGKMDSVQVFKSFVTMKLEVADKYTDRNCVQKLLLPPQ